MAGSSRPHRQHKSDRLITPGATQAEIECDYALAPLDRAALDMDRKYGIDRLPELVGPDLALRYGAAMAHLNASLAAADPAATAAAAANCIRGLAAMDAAARAAGHKPITPLVWECEHEGRKFGVIREVGDWPAVAAERPGLTLYTLHEVAVALAARREALPMIEAVKGAFPGAQISAVRKRTELETALDDEIPWN